MPSDHTLGTVSSDPEREAQLHIEALRGLENADLKPLAELLRSGFELNEFLAIDIANAIEGKHSKCRISAKKSRRGRPSANASKYSSKDLEIAVFVHQRKQASGYESAILEAEDAFGVKRTSITDAIRRAKNKRDSLPKEPLPVWDRKFQNK